jgi:TPR repeat protein
MLYRSADGNQKDYGKALEWLTKAGAYGNAKAQYSLGDMYEYGQGVPIDRSKALSWFMMAAFKQYPEAMNAVGYYYQNGIGTEEDQTIARDWYQKAADAGSAAGALNLAWYYENGKDQDQAIAFKYYKKSAELNSAAGMFALGRFYDDGRGTSVDRQEAIKWYLRATDAGFARAAYRLAYAYDATFSSDNAAENILLAIRQGDGQITDELKVFSPFTRTALKRSLSRRGLYDGPLDDEIDQPLKSALANYTRTYGG